MSRRDGGTWCAVCCLCDDTAGGFTADRHQTADHVVSALRTLGRLSPNARLPGLPFLGGLSHEAAAAVLVGATLTTLRARRGATGR